MECISYSDINSNLKVVVMRYYFPHYPQLDSSDCGPTCLRMIAKHYSRSYSVQYLREQAFITREGVSMLDDGQAPLLPQEEAHQALPHGDIAATHDPAVSRLF